MQKGIKKKQARRETQRFYKKKIDMVVFNTFVFLLSLEVVTVLPGVAVATLSQRESFEHDLLYTDDDEEGSGSGSGSESGDVNNAR